MTIEEFKAYALRTMLEENLWKVGESDVFTFNGVKYKLELCFKYFGKDSHSKYFSLSTFNSFENTWNKEKRFNSLTELFRHIFRTWQIKY